MKTISVILCTVLFLLSGYSMSCAQKWNRQSETVVVTRDIGDAVTIEIKPQGIYVNGKQMATRAEINNERLNKKIIIQQDRSSSSSTNKTDRFGNNDDYTTVGQRPLLGVYIANTPYDDGALIESVTPGGAADNAGLQRGDIIFRLDNNIIKGAKDLREAVSRYRPGEKITVSYTRNKRDRQTTVQLGAANDISEEMMPPLEEPLAAPPPSYWYNDWNKPQEPELGLSVEEMTNGTGVKVTAVRPNSAAEAAGVRSGDMLVGLNEREIKSINDIRDALEENQGGRVLTIQVVRNGKRLSKTAQVPEQRNRADF